MIKFRLRDSGRRYLVAFFVDGLWLHQIWHCHRLPKRSFHLGGRQFHVCARCTGIIVGALGSIFLLPLRDHLIWPFIFSVIAMIADGFTQLFQLRMSNNVLRFSTGIGFGLTTLPALMAMGGV